jgi:hypothetical protein
MGTIITAKATHDANAAIGEAGATPTWNDGLGTLAFKGVMVLTIEKSAKNLRAILNAFERQGWPAWIPNPIKPAFDTDDRQRLADAVYKLNRGTRVTRMISFRRDGQGKGIIWQGFPNKTKKIG